MNERVVQFRVGVVVIATILIVLLLIMLISGDELFDLSRKYPVRIQFSSAPGVAAGTPVHKNGVLIGRVSELQLNDDGVSVVANINDNVTLKNTDMPRVTSSLLRGDASIEFVPNRRDGDGSRLAPGAELKGEVQPDPIESFASMQGDIGTTVKALGDAGNQVAELADRVNGMLGDVDDRAVRRSAPAYRCGDHVLHAYDGQRQQDHRRRGAAAAIAGGMPVCQR